MKNDNKRNIMFNIYYVNLPKVYELSMMVNNIILETIETKKDLKKSFKLSNKFKNKYIDIETGISKSLTNTLKENFSIKYTKSILLRYVMEKSFYVQNINKLEDKNIGDLLIIDDVKLNLFNEQIVRYISALRKEALKDFVIEESNNMKVSDISVIFEDYAYILEANKGGETFFFKIPCEIKAEFENKYTINDIIIGKVSIIGIYKGMIEKNIVEQNTFDYFINTQNVINNYSNKKIENSYNNYSDIVDDDKNNNNIKIKYIDIIAIIQNLNTYSIKKENFFIKIKRKLIRKKNIECNNE
ncbi:hypothetical protein [Brachyspira pilosicoli]|uniref:hypothetical protein n=1 Tax=Brachyspira pilosicoli TaxID=52584 RepID=UPI0012F4F0C1|nr:hypothetical protein [Brachyspira pilosicoli]